MLFTIVAGVLVVIGGPGVLVIHGELRPLRIGADNKVEHTQLLAHQRHTMLDCVIVQCLIVELE